MVEKRLLSSKRPSCSSPLCPSPRVYPALKSTPDDFLLHLSTYNPSFSPPRSFTRHRPSAAPASLYVLSFSNMQACVQTLLLSKELLPHAERPSSLPFAPSGSSCCLPGAGGGGVREKGAAAWACCQALPLFLWHDFAPSVLIGE